MPNDDRKALVRRKLKLLFEAVAEHAMENQQFMESLERILVLSGNENRKTATKRKYSSIRSADPNLLDVLHSRGEIALLEILNAMTTDELVRVCVREGLRKQKEAKNIERPNLILMLQEMANLRLMQGGSFVR